MIWNRTTRLAAAGFVSLAAILWIATTPWSGTGTHAVAQQEEAEPPMGMMQMSEQHMGMMQRVHAGDDSAWHATEEAIFVIRGRQLLRYDPQSLELVAEAELPEEVSPVFGVERDEAAENADPPRRMQRMQRREQMQERMQHMQQVMMESQTSLQTDLRVVGDAIYVARGDHLLRYSQDLELQEATQLPELPELNGEQP